MSILIFLVMLMLLVFVHELGHFSIAKLFRIRVDEFGFGFPPRLFGIKRGETIYSINLIPFGGFVKIFGETPSEDSINGPDAERSFVHKPKLVQAAVLAAGVVFNIVFAWLLLSAGFISGLPSSVGSVQNAQVRDAALVVTNVLPGSPAHDAGLEVGDKIISLSAGNDTLTDPDPKTLPEFVNGHGEEEVSVVYVRKGEELSSSISPSTEIIDGKSILGISMDEIGILKLPVHRALIEGAELTAYLTKETAVSLFVLVRDAIIGQADLSTVAGPVGIVGIVGDAYEFGFVYLLSFAALISINLAIINLIPFPALDGGRLIFVAIEAIKGSPIKPKIANTINAIGFMLLLLLMVAVTYNDIIRLLK